jgi:protein translocase SecG subunit
MKNLLEIVQLVFGVLLIGSILLQHRGTGLGGAFGGLDMSYRSRRGMEKFLLRSTILLTAIFLVATVAQLFV